jgi:hypothetical protein
MEQQDKKNEKVLLLSYVRREKWVVYDSLIASGKWNNKLDKLKCWGGMELMSRLEICTGHGDSGEKHENKIEKCPFFVM